MAVPTDPNKILIKNSIYPNGLTTQRIYEYYMDNKETIIKYTKNKPVLLFMKLTEDKPEIIKRKHIGKDIILTEETYETYINGHVISISYEPNYNKIEKLIIDIDPTTKKINDKDLKKCIKEDLDKLDLNNLFKSNSRGIHKKIYASRKGFHLIYDVDENQLNGSPNIDWVRNSLKNLLVSQFGDKYLIFDKSRKTNSVPHSINLDLSSMTKRGSITAPYSLTRDGTIYTEVDSIDKFDRRSTYL